MIGQPADLKQTPDKKPLWAAVILAGILMVGLILRISYLQEIVNDPAFCLPQLDAGYHDYWARGLATGDWTVPDYFSDPEIRIRPYIRPPGYPFFLAFVYCLSGSSYVAARVVQMGLGLVNCLLAFFLGKTLFGRGTGLIFAAFMSMYWAFIYFEGELVAPVLLISLGLSLMHILRLWYDKITFWRAFAGGIFLGLFALVRPNILLFGLVVLGWFWWVARKRYDGRPIGITWLGFVLGAAMIISPATIRNYMVAHDFVMITSPNAGVNLYIGNNEESNGIYSGIPHLEELVGEDRWSNFDYPKIIRGIELLQGKEMKHSEVSSYFTKKAIDYIRKNPARVLKLVAIKTALFWGPKEVSNNKEIHYEKSNSPTLRHIPGFPIAISLAIFGLIQLFRGRKKQRRQNKTIALVTQRQFEISLLIFLFIVTYFISFLPFFVAERFRIPIIPFLFLFGAHGLYRIGQKAASHDFYGLIFSVLFCIGLYLAAGRELVPYKPNLAEWHFSRGIVNNYAKKFDTAIEDFRKAIRLEPDSVKAHISLGLAFAAKGKPAEAIVHYSEALQIKPDSVNAHNNLGAALVAQGKLDEAINHYSEALRIRPGFANAHNNLGLTLLRKGETTEAISHFSEALRVEPDHAQAHNNLGLALAKQGRMTEAINHYTEALRIRPNFAKAHNNLGLALAKQEKTAKAIEHYCEAIRIKPDYAKAHNNLGLALAKQGRITEAVTHYSEALRIRPEYPKAHSNLGLALAAQGKSAEAIDHYNEALRIKPDSVEVHNNLGAALVRKGKIEEAIFHFQEALRIRPDFGRARENLKKVLTAQEKIDEGVEKVQKALELRPEDPELHYKLGNLFKRKGEWDEAIDRYEKALSIKPDFTQALDNLAVAYAITGEDDRAISVFKRKIELRPDNAGDYYNIACIYAKKNRIKESIDWLNKAVERGYDNWDLIKTDKDLENIRESLYYKELMKAR